MWGEVGGWGERVELVGSEVCGRIFDCNILCGWKMKCRRLLCLRKLC